ncbi:MAG: excinuclease ABC subunit C [Proteobacteria bacterium]|nr:MAG: excinuclease ABC subunit C [Pseudomonadota bacterium]
MSTPSPSSFDSKAFLKTVPHKPGVYCMMSADNTVLYVGKAKDLKNRVSSYFRDNLVNSRIWSMVKQVCDVQITITETEAEALLLESNLIKKHNTRYNVLLRDDKSYPYIHISDGIFPRVSFHRGARNKKGQFFGPYPSAGAVRETLGQLQKLFKARQCEDSYFRNRSRPCLQYQIKRCTAPCTNEITEDDYRESIRYTVQFLQGKSQQLIETLVAQMDKAAAQLHFEQAAEYRDQIEKVRLIAQQQYVSGGQGDVDVIALQMASGVACVQVMTIRGGNNLGSRNYFPRLPAVELEEGVILAHFMGQYYLTRTIPARILVSHQPDNVDVLMEMLRNKAGRKLNIIWKPRGDGARWLVMASKNALHALQNKLISKESLEKRLDALQEALALDYIPSRMECYDISHTQGEATVASRVVFGTDGPVKSEYRRYNISDITPGDDYAAMSQVLTRRFSKVTEEGAKLPDILFIDGGKGQVNEAVKVLESLQILGVDIVGVTKGEGRRAELDTLTIGKRRVELPAHSSALHLIQQIRDEAHRFAITGHRAKRQKSRTISPLEGIEGLGPKRRQELLKQFGGLRAVTRASVEELAKVNEISRTLAEKIYDRFNGE